MEQREILRLIPKVDELLAQSEIIELQLPAAVVRDAAREELETLRRDILSGKVGEVPSVDQLCAAICRRAKADALPSLRAVVNGTGVVLHTNLGRACLSEQAAAAVYAVARGYSTLEYDVESGSRGSRHSHIEELLTRITGAEAALVVNNNAAAVLLILSALGKGGEVVISRGELVEIGGSFRVPEIVVQCGCTLREVGATNKTHLYDYENAIRDDTRALMKVHTSNYKIVGFSESVPLPQLVTLAHSHGLPMIQDLGSGTLVELTQFGIHGEPTVQQSVKAGVDVISFSGDKLLGGPQAGVIVGKKEYIDLLKKHPLARAVRVDKMTIAALRETLYSYLDEGAALQEIPTLSMLASAAEVLHAKAALLRDTLAHRGIAAELVAVQDQVGGGSVPTQLLDSWAVAIDPGTLSVDQLEEQMRRQELPVIGRIHKNRYLLDARTLMERDFTCVADTAARILKP